MRVQTALPCLAPLPDAVAGFSMRHALLVLWPLPPAADRPGSQKQAAAGAQPPAYDASLPQLVTTDDESSGRMKTGPSSSKNSGPGTPPLGNERMPPAAACAGSSTEMLGAGFVVGPTGDRMSSTGDLCSWGLSAASKLAHTHWAPGRIYISTPYLCAHTGQTCVRRRACCGGAWLHENGVHRLPCTAKPMIFYLRILPEDLLPDDLRARAPGRGGGPQEGS